jgi:hypothetical protein
MPRFGALAEAGESCSRALSALADLDCLPDLDFVDYPVSMAKINSFEVVRPRAPPQKSRMDSGSEGQSSCVETAPSS